MDENKKKKASNTSDDILEYYADDDLSEDSEKEGDSILDEWLNSNQKTLENQRQKDLREAYVNQQLVEKYLPEELLRKGVANSGLAQLYAQQANNDYMKTRGDINSNYSKKEQELLNSYYAEKKADEEEALAKEEAKLKEKQKAIYQMYINDITKSINPYGFIDDATKQELLDSFDYDALGEDYSSLIGEYMNRYEGTSEQRNNRWFYEEADRILADKVVELDGEHGDGLLSEEQMNMLREYAESQRENMTDSQWKEFMDKVESFKQSDEDYIAKNFSGVDVNSYVDVKDAGVTSFGAFQDSGTGNGMQDNWVKEILAKSNSFKDGDLIDFDYGQSQDKGNSVWMYYKGRFYKTNKSRKEADIYVDGNYNLYMYGKKSGKK